MNTREPSLSPDDAPPDAGPPRRLECPRCGQDLRGLPAAWRDQCPLTGRCPECGLDIAWRELLTGMHDHPDWCVEGARSIGDWARRVPRQCWIALVRPRRMLRGLRMEQRPRPWRIAPLLLVAILIVPVAVLGRMTQQYVALGAPPLVAFRTALSPWQSKPVFVNVPLPADGDQFVAVVQPDGRMRLSLAATQLASTPIDPPELGPGAVLPIDGFSILMRTDADRPVHVWAHMQRWISEGPPSASSDESPRHMMRGLPQADPTLPGPLSLDAFQGRLTVPFETVRGISATSVQIARGATTVPALLPSAAILALGQLRGGMLAVPIAVAPLLLPLPLAAVGFVVLPIARRRARVRWQQVVRIGAYAALTAVVALVPVLIVVEAAGPVLDLGSIADRMLDRGLVWTLGGRSVGTVTLVSALVLIVPTVLTAIWWRWATRDYLRMEPSMPVAVSVAALGSLASFVLLQAAFGVIA